MVRLLIQTGIVVALVFNMWISFRVLDDWSGLWAAISGVVLFPVTTIVLPVVMFFVPSGAAGALSLWPGVIVIGGLAGLLRRHNGRRSPT